MFVFVTFTLSLLGVNRFESKSDLSTAVKVSFSDQQI